MTGASSTASVALSRTPRSALRTRAKKLEGRRRNRDLRPRIPMEDLNFGSEVRSSALVPSLSRRRTDDPDRSTPLHGAALLGDRPLHRLPLCLRLGLHSCLGHINALSLLSHVRISSNSRTLNKFRRLVDSKGTFKSRIYEFSNVPVAANPQFSWFCKPLRSKIKL